MKHTLTRFVGIALLTKLIVTGLPAVAQSVHIAHCLQGCPLGTAASNEVIVRHLFAVSINQQTRVADWAAYRIIDGSIGVASLLPRLWRDDELMENGFQSSELRGGSTELSRTVIENQQESTYQLNEFVLNTSEQGRLIPMSSFADSSYWPDLNLLSVMSMINTDMRLGPWARLDQAANLLAQKTGEVYVVVGPVYALDSGNPIEINSTNIPTAYFKIVANQAGEVAAFLFDQSLEQHAYLCSQKSDLATIETLSGLNLFPQSRDWPRGSLLDALGCE